jgi:hypothetical protein
MVMAWRSRKRHTLLGAKRTPWRSRSSAASSSRVMSARAATAARMAPPYASIRRERRSPPCRLAAAWPCARHAATQRTALDAETPNRAAAACRDIPPSTAAITRERKSCERALAIRAGLLRQHEA